VRPTRGRLRPLGLGEVRITGGFWARRQQTNATATLEHCLNWERKAGWIDNFRAAADGQAGRDRRGPVFSDSDVYKLLEAMCWEAGRSGDTVLDATVEETTAVIEQAQQPEGYLSTAFGGPGLPGRYSDLEWGHELYCHGHLIQAGVAQARARGEGSLTRLARRAADHVCATFGPGGVEGVCGHPVIEAALAELARLTGEERYLDQARLFVERRGRHTLRDIAFGRAYFQDDVPVREATALRGHAVRALYLAGGAVDVAVEDGDAELLAAVVRQWEAAVTRRTYLTGGMGSHHADESFGDDFVLPPDRAYAETCAGVASVGLGWRLLLATGEPRFADLAERTLYNVVAASPAEDGRAFFYANTLHQRRRGAAPNAAADSPRAALGLRAPWFAVSCCPTNVARTLASLDGYLATADDHGVQLHQYADAEVATVLDGTAGGREAGFTVRTGYPYDGDIAVRITRSHPGPWTLTLRVPDWAGDGAELVGPDGTRRPAAPGAVAVTRAFRVGDEVRLRLPVAPRWVTADPRIDAVRGCVAVERGPLVLCAESADLPDGREVDAIAVDPAVPPRDTDAGAARVAVSGVLADHGDRAERAGGADHADHADQADHADHADRSDRAAGDWPYPPQGAPAAPDTPAEIALVPYHSWANRGPSTMRVWLPVAGPPRP
jgi:hypothetical protein